MSSDQVKNFLENIDDQGKIDDPEEDRLFEPDQQGLPDTSCDKQGPTCFDILSQGNILRNVLA